MNQFGKRTLASVVVTMALISSKFVVANAADLDVEPIGQETNWCWSASAQMMVNEGLESLNVQERALGYSQPALNLSRGPGTYDSFLQAIRDKNMTISDTLTTNDEIEQAMITYMAKSNLDNVGGTDENIAKPILYVLECAGKDNYQIVDLAIKSDTIDRDLWTNLNARFINESLKMGFPVAFNRDDNHWRLISGIEGSTIEIQDTDGKEAIHDNIGYLLDNQKSYGYLLHMNGVWKDEYVGTPFVLTGALNQESTIKKDQNQALSVKVACTDSKVTLISANGERKVIDLEQLQEYGQNSKYALEQQFYLDDSAAYRTSRRNIYTGTVTIENPGVYKLVSGSSSGDYNTVTKSYLFEVVANTDLPSQSTTSSQSSSWFSGYSSGSSSGGGGSSGGGYSSGSSGGSSSNTESQKVETVWGESIINSVIPVVTYKVGAQNTTIDSNKAFASIINSDQNKTINFVTDNAVWSFESKNLNKDSSKLYNFNAGVSVNAVQKSAGMPQNIASTLEGKKSMVVSFAKTGLLPGMAKVKVKVGDDYRNKEVYVYYLNGNGKISNLQLISKTAKVDENGCATFQLNHGCDFIIVEKSDAQTVEASLDAIAKSIK